MALFFGQVSDTRWIKPWWTC